MGNKQSRDKHGDGRSPPRSDDKHLRNNRKPGPRGSSSSQEIPSSGSTGSSTPAPAPVPVHPPNSSKELTCIAKRRVSDFAVPTRRADSDGVVPPGSTSKKVSNVSDKVAERESGRSSSASRVDRLNGSADMQLPQLRVLAAPDELQEGSNGEETYLDAEVTISENRRPSVSAGYDIQRSPSSQSVPSLTLSEVNQQIEMDISDSDSINRESNGSLVPKINITKSAATSGKAVHTKKHHNTTSSPTADPPIQLSNLEVSLVRRAWTQARHRGYNEPGSSIMKEVFAQNPEIKDLFRGTKKSGGLTTTTLGITRTPSLRKKSEEAIDAMQLMEQRLHDGAPLQPEFRFAAHAEKLTQELDAVVENLENLAIVEKRLIDSGRKHFEVAGENGFKQHHWDLFARCMAERSLVWGGAFHQRRNSKTTEAWVKVCLFVVNSTKRGYLLEARRARMRRRSADVPRPSPKKTHTLEVNANASETGRGRSESIY